MNLYISSPSDVVLSELAARCPGLKLNILVTMARLPASNMDSFFKKHSGIIGSKVIDCGSWSVNNSNLGFTVDELFARLIPYAKSAGEQYEMVFSMDDAFGPDGWEHNHLRLLEMETRGLNVVPVVHNLQNHEIKTYIDRGHEYIAIGQSKERTDPENLFRPVFRMRNAGVKVHLFGITKFSLITGCPCYSCDSKSWIDDSKCGEVRFWNPEKLGVDKTDRIYFPNEYGKIKDGAALYSEYHALDTFIKFLGDNLGIGIREIIGRNEVLYRQLANILYYKTIEEEATKIHLANTPLWIE